MKTHSKRARKKKRPPRLGYVKYRRVSTMRDKRAHAGRWKRLRHANGTLAKRMGNRRTWRATRRRGERKERAVVVDGDVVAVEVADGVAAKARATLQQTATRGLRQPPGQRPTGRSGERTIPSGMQTRHSPDGQVDLAGIDHLSVPIMRIHLIVFISLLFHNAKRHPLDLKSPSTPESDKEGS